MCRLASLLTDTANLYNPAHGMGTNTSKTTLNWATWLSATGQAPLWRSFGHGADAPSSFNHQSEAIQQ
jgi:hypothetical protein